MDIRKIEKKESIYRNYIKNTELSAVIGKKHQRWIRPKECYHNIWRIVTSEDFNKSYQIAYGFVQAFDHVYVLHCFLVNEEDQVIDPTLPDSEKDNYYILRRFSYQEYLREICESRYPSMENRNWLKKAVKDFTNWSMENGIIAIS